MPFKDFEEESLLGHSQEAPSLGQAERSFINPKGKPEQILRWLWRPISLHISFILLYTLLFFYVLRIVRKDCLTEDNVIFTPYTGEIEPKVFQHEHSVYVGNPTAELDNAWGRLLKNSNIRVTEWEMNQIPGRKEQAIPLPDGGYFASLNVYHNLHCIKRLHHYMYSEHYFPNISEKQKIANEYHSHHCLDMLRQSIMCQGDTQLLTMKWMSENSIPTANFTMPHKCVNWDLLEAWARGRRIEHLMEPGYLIHPTLGAAYPGGHGDIIGEFIT